MSEYVYDMSDARNPLREEIVRCRVCEHMSEHHYRDMLGFGRETIVYRCDYFWNADELPEVEPDGFCAWAVKRKEGGE